MATVLVVDDSQVDRLMIGHLLRKSRLDTAYATDGRQALRAMSEARPQLVVTDLVMPNMSGLELVATVVKTYPLVPTILTTGRGSDTTAMEALNAGASSYLPKRLLEDRLLDNVESLLAIARDVQGGARATESWGCDFSIDNDVTKIPPLIAQIRWLLCRAELCDEAGGIRVCVALEEALTNALFHGNLELDSQLREEDHRAFRALVEERRSADPYRNRQIRVAVSIQDDHGAIVIRDEGKGFDVTSCRDPTAPANLQRLSGRGLLLMHAFMDEVRYNDAGNEVTLIKRKQLAHPSSASEAHACQSQNTLPPKTRMVS